jgi:hypothetical protein
LRKELIRAQRRLTLPTPKVNRREEVDLVALTDLLANLDARRLTPGGAEKVRPTLRPLEEEQVAHQAKKLDRIAKKMAAAAKPAAAPAPAPTAPTAEPEKK